MEVFSVGLGEVVVEARYGGAEGVVAVGESNKLRNRQTSWTRIWIHTMLTQ